MLPQSADWAFVVPKPGCAIVNVGDGTYFSTFFQESGFLTLKPGLMELLE